MALIAVDGLPELTVDPAALTRRLARWEAPVGRVVELERLAGGISNVTLLVRGESGECVIRRRPFGTIPARAHDMHHEYRVLSAMAGTGLPIPRVYGYCEDEDCVGAPFYAMEFVAGLVLQDRADAEQLTAAQRGVVSADLVGVLAELHAVPLASNPVYQEGRGRHFVRRQIGRWQQRWRVRPHRDLPIVDELAERLCGLVPAAEDVTVVHGDYRLGNTIVNPHEQRPVKAILDWELSTFGNPLTDLAHLVAYWEPTGERYSHRAQHIADAPGFLDGAELAERYSTLSGRSVSDLPFYVAYEHWRAVIIKEGVYQRRLELGAPPEEAEEVRQGVDGHLAEALARLSAA